MTTSKPTQQLLSKAKRVRKAMARSRQRGQLGPVYSVRHDRYRSSEERISLPRFY